ncbi:GPW/gp25 family protein [Methylopila sp. M107]|uniref:GPW/gp25 family protein n=1 Tax=Methylopila sp. M107 TaxID=1101190 RepID=UPI000364E9B6|nr:GPW/gp25 family protein [Methylopila sp. M107]
MSGVPEMRLPRISYMAFPFRIERDGATQSLRLDHIREQVEQVLFTSAGERVFRPEFGFGARMFVFEPSREQLWDVVRNRLYGSLSEALAGEVDPKTLRVEVGATPDQPERMLVTISYVLAAIQKQETHTFPV